MNAAERFRAHLEKAADCDEGVDFDVAEVRAGLTELFALEHQVAALTRSLGDAHAECARRGDIIARVAGATLHIESSDGPLWAHVEAMMQRGARAEARVAEAERAPKQVEGDAQCSECDGWGVYRCEQCYSLLERKCIFCHGTGKEQPR